MRIPVSTSLSQATERSTGQEPSPLSWSPLRPRPRTPACRWTRPRPSSMMLLVSTTCSPTRSRRTATAWCASSPSTVQRSRRRRRRPGPAPGRRAGDIGVPSVACPGRCAAGRRRTSNPGCTWPDGCSSSRIAASSRRISSCRGSSLVGVSTTYRDDQVAALRRAGRARRGRAGSWVGAGLGAGA